MLEPILKGLIEWIYGMMLELMSYVSGELLGVMSMDLSYFKATAPIITEVIDVFVALGWALLIGNLIFQSLKSIMSGAGFEAEDPKVLFLRTFVFSFLLLASQEICEIGLSITSKVIDLLELPNSIDVQICDETMFSFGGGAKWLLVIIVNVILMIQMVKLLFEIGERYVITSVLTFFSPLAFSMGGSKNTNDIFKGWVRMYCSMLLMMIMNIVFLKLIMSAMSQLAGGGGVLVWLVFVVALTRVARKIDSHIGKIGLAPAQTGNPIGGSLTGLMTMMAVRVMSSAISRNLGGSKGEKGQQQGSSGSRRSHNGRGARPYRVSNTENSAQTHNTGNNTVNQNSKFNGSLKVNPEGQPKTTSKQKEGKYVSPPASRERNNVSNSNSIPILDGTGRGADKESETIQGTDRKTSVKGEKVASGTRPPIPRSTNDTPAGNVGYYDVKKQPIHKDGVTSAKITQSETQRKVSKNDKGRVGGVTHNSLHTGGVQASAEISHKNGDIQSNAGISFQHSQSGENISIGGNFTENNLENYRENGKSLQSSSKTADKTVNHEYKHGRFNPAAANKKTKNIYYTKDIYPFNNAIEKEKRRKRREENGKHKR